MSEFAGFPKQTRQFLRELSENNQREWFAENRDRYQAYFLEPALSFIRAMQKPLEKTAPLLKADAKKSGGSLMRIYKDTRFSTDKTPYKTNIGIHFRHSAGKDVHAPGVYVHIDPKQCFLGIGIWMPPSAELKRIRQHLVENPAQWKRVTNKARFKQSFELHEDRLKTAPRGFDKNHPLIDDLRRKSFIGTAPLNAKLVESRELVPEATRLIKLGRPLMEFLGEALQQPY